MERKDRVWGEKRHKLAEAPEMYVRKLITKNGDHETYTYPVP